MSQLLNGRIAHTCKRLFSVVGLICVGATTLISQQVETIKTDQPVTCDGKQYEVRLVSATTTLGTRNASALAIALTPSDATPSKVFGVYWIDSKKPLPTHRDDTSGAWIKNLEKYGAGQSKSKEPIVNVFFPELKCSTDSQVSGMQKVLETQNLLDPQTPFPIKLDTVAQQLSNYGVAVDPGKVEQASTGNLDLFRNLANETEFAKAIRQHVSNILAAGGRNDPVGNKPTPQEQIAMLEAKNKDLEEKTRKFDEEKAAFLGAAPGWLVVAFPIMSGLSVVGLIFIGLAVYVLVQRRRSGVNFLSRARTEPSASPKSSSTSTALAALADQELTRKLSDLTTVVNGVKSNVEAVKSTVEQVGLNVEQSFAGNSALQDIWTRFYEGKNKPYPRKVPENFTREVGEVIQLYRFLSQHYGRSGDSVVATMNAAQQIVRELYSVRDNYLHDALETDARVEQIVSSLSWSLKERSTAQQELRRFYPNRNLPQIVQAVVTSHEAILRETDQISPQQTNSIHERVSALVREYRRLKPKADRAEELEARSHSLQAKLDTATSELRAGETLVDEIAQQLNFKTDSLNPQDNERIAATLNRLKTEKSSSPYLQLRLGLSSALLAMEKAVSPNGSTQDVDLRDALFLNKVMQALRQVLARMEECSGDQLWTNILYEGFNQQWLHYLLRADLLLRTYYSTCAELSLLRKAISLACNSILAALHDYHVEVRELELFETLPPNIDTEPVYP